MSDRYDGASTSLQKERSMRTCLLLLTLLNSGLLFAQDDPQKGVIKGRKAPDFVATNEKGKEFKLSQFMKKGDKHVVLVFSRGAF